MRLLLPQALQKDVDGHDSYTNCMMQDGSKGNRYFGFGYSTIGAIEISE